MKLNLSFKYKTYGYLSKLSLDVVDSGKLLLPRNSVYIIKMPNKSTILVIKFFKIFVS